MEVAETNFRMLTTTESVDVRRESSSSNIDDDKADTDDTVHHCCSNVSFKKNILHRYCEYRHDRVNAEILTNTTKYQYVV